MRSIDPAGADVAWRGVAWLRPEPGGVSPRRVAPHLLDRLDGPSALRVNAAGGARMVVRTDAAEVELRCRILSLTPDEPVARSAADLVVAGELVDSRGPEPGGVDPANGPDDGPGGCDGGSSEARSSGVGATADESVFRLRRVDPAMEELEIWIPHDAITTVTGLRIPGDARWEPPGPDPSPRWVHHGSSISHGGQAHSPSRTWPAVAARLAGVQLHNLAFPGECQIDQFAARTIRDLPAEVISLELGVNVVNGATMTARTFTSAVHGFLDTVRDGHPEVPLLVISPVVFPAAEDRPGPTVLSGGRLVATGDPAAIGAGALTISRVREVLAAVVATRRREGDGLVDLISGLDLLGPAEAAMLDDGLHPGPDGHLLIGRRLAPHLVRNVTLGGRAATD